MNLRNRRTIKYAVREDAIDPRNRVNVVYAPSGPLVLRRSQKNPPPPERDAIRDRLGALMVEIDEVPKYEGI